MRLPATIIRDSQVSRNGLAVAAVLWEQARFEDERPVCWFSKREIASAANLDIKATERALHNLVSCGYLHRATKPSNLNQWESWLLVRADSELNDLRNGEAPADTRIGAPRSAALHSGKARKCRSSKPTPPAHKPAADTAESGYRRDGYPVGREPVTALDGNETPTLTTTSTPTPTTKITTKAAAPKKSTKGSKNTADPKATGVGGDLRSKPSKAKREEGRMTADHCLAVLDLSGIAKRNGWFLGTQREIDDLDALLRAQSARYIEAGHKPGWSGDPAGGVDFMKRVISNEVKPDARIRTAAGYVKGILSRCWGLEDGEPTSEAIEGGEGQGSGHSVNETSEALSESYDDDRWHDSEAAQ